MSNPTTRQQLNEARELMHTLVTGGYAWQLKVVCQDRIHRLQAQLAAETARDLELLTSIFS